MYEEFYGLKEKPFSLTPDPKFLFLSEEHRSALELLLYSIRRREGFALLTGEVGTGKTLLCRALVERLDPNTKVALILNPMLSEKELLKAILQDLGLDYNKETKKELIDELNSFLLKQAAQGGTTVLIIDEAQNLSFEVLEQIRLLSNLETDKEKLIQIILVGQEELKEKLELPRLRQLNQRISVRYHLTPLSKDEVRRYIDHRLMIAGSNGEVVFSKGAINVIYRCSRGIPRLINLICDRALLCGYIEQTYEITGKLARRAAKEIGKEEGYRISSAVVRYALRYILPILIAVGAAISYLIAGGRLNLLLRYLKVIG